MDLFLLRHAQPEWVRDDRSRTDPNLTELGHRQAAAAAGRLGEVHLDRILVSTAVRAQETAAPVVEAVGPEVPVEHHDWLFEIRPPDGFEGTPADEVEATFRALRGSPRDTWWAGIPDGESFRDFHARVVAGLDAWLVDLGFARDEQGLWHVPDDAPERVLVVAHAGTNSVILGHLLGLDPEPWEWERFASDHASLTWLRTTRIAGQAIFSLQRFSDVEHLGGPDVPITG